MSRLSRSPTLLVMLALWTIAAVPAHAQVPLSPRSLGMGGAMIAAARGQDAVFLNPANLGLADTPRWSVGLVGISAEAVLEGIELAEAVDLFQYDDLSDSEKAEMLGNIPDAGVRLAADVRTPVASVQIGSFGFGVGFLTLGGHSVSRDLVDLLLNGYQEGRTDYRVDDTRGDRASLWDVAVAYGTSTGPVSWGITGHALFGGTLVRTWMADPRIDLVGRDIDVDYFGLRSKGGTGMALDLGAAYDLGAGITLSGVVTNAFSRVNWSDDVQIRQLQLTRQDFDSGEGLQDLRNRYENSEREFGPGDEDLLTETPQAFLQADAQLPSTATLGIAWQPGTGTDVVASYSEDVTDGRLGGEWTRRFGGGLEQRFWLLAARLGGATNLDGEQMLTGGLSLGPLHLGIARVTGDREGTDRAGWIGSFGLSTRMR